MNNLIPEVTAKDTASVKMSKIKHTALTKKKVSDQETYYFVRFRKRLYFFCHQDMTDNT